MINYTVEYSMVRTIDGLDYGVIEVLVGDTRICQVGNNSERGFPLFEGTQVALMIASARLRELAIRMQESVELGISHYHPED